MPAGFDFGFHTGGIEAEFGAHFFLSSLWNKEVRQTNVQHRVLVYDGPSALRSRRCLHHP